MSLFWMFVSFLLPLTSGAGSFRPDRELSQLITDLWNSDVNSCVPDDDYKITIQGYVTSTHHTDRDRARSKLFNWVDEKDVFNRPTYKAFKALLDNYATSTTLGEQESAAEKQENNKFLDAILQTNVMKKCHDFLKKKRKAPASVADFKKKLYNLWFHIYRRTRSDNRPNSSGFEHVFVGETRDKDVIGFHNWVQFYLQEKAGNIDYRGYFRRGTTEEYETQPHMMTLQFFWKQGSRGTTPVKPIGGFFIGTSPEFEVALYTTVFLMGKEKVQIQMGDYKVEVRCYKHGDGIGTAYPQSLDD